MIPQAFAITTDLWQEDFRKVSYISLTLHVLDKTVCPPVLRSFIGKTVEFPYDTKTATNLKNFLCDLLRELDIPLERTVIVTDNGSNMLKAMQLLRTQGLISSLSCVLHSISLGAKSTFSDKGAEGSVQVSC